MSTGSSFNQTLARIAVNAYDDAQDVRTSLMNRVRDLIRKRNEGIPLDEVEGEKETQSYDSKYQDENLPDIIEEMLEEDKLSNREFEYLQTMLEAAGKAAEVEDTYSEVMEITENEPIFKDWLVHVNGVASTLTARLIYQFGYCEDFERVSNLWSYCGLAPGQDRTRGEKLGYNPDAKTLGWLVADRIIMQGTRSMYKTEFYDPYKEKQVSRMEDSSCKYCGEPTIEHGGERCEEAKESGVDAQDFTNGNSFTLPDQYKDDATPPWNQGHADNRARRYLAKKFLKHYWAISRDMQELDTPDEWVIAHGGHEKKEESFEYPFYAKRQVKK